MKKSMQIFLSETKRCSSAAARPALGQKICCIVACELETRALSVSGFNPDSVAVALAGVKMAALAAS